MGWLVGFAPTIVGVVTLVDVAAEAAPFMTALRDNHPEIRAQAARSLGQIAG